MKSFRIYIVEDEALIAMELGDRLQQLGYETAGRAAHGETALVEIPQVRPDLVLMDIQLAGKLNGIETTTRLRPLCDVPVVFLSAFSDSKLIEEAIQAGSFGYLVKPFEERELHATLQAALYKHKVEQLLRSDKERLEAAIQQRTAQLYQSEAALKLFRTLVDRVDDAIEVIDPATGRFLDINEQACAELGYTREEMLAMTVPDIAPVIDLAGFAGHVQIIRASGAMTVESVHRRKDGTTFPVEVRLSYVRQQRDYVVAVVRDITARKQAEEALRTSEENLAVTLNSIGDAVLATDARGHITRLNPVAEHLTGWTQREALGRPVAEVFHIINENTRQPAVIPMYDTIAHGVTHGLANHTVLIARDGTERAIADSCAPIRDRTGGVIGAVLVFRDVTEDKKAQTALREVSTRLDFLVSASPATIFTTTATPPFHTPFISANQQAMLGYAPEVFMKAPGFWMEQIHPDDRTGVLAENILVLAKGTHQHDYRFRHRDGRWLWLHADRRLVRNDAGEPLEIIGCATDITAQKEAEAALHELNTSLEQLIAERTNELHASEQRLSLAIEATSEGLWDWNIATGEVYYSPQWLRLLGYAADEVPARVEFFFGILHPDDVESTRRTLDEHLAGRTPAKEAELRLRTKDGGYRWFLDRGKVVRHGSDGQPLRMVGTIADITERRHIQQSLQLTQFSIDHAVDATFWIKADATILYVNDAACRALGYHRAELIGKTVPEIDPSFPAAAWPAHWAELREKKSLTLESEHITKDGRIIQTEVTTNFIEFEGQEYNCAFMRDITRRKADEQARRESEERFRLLFAHSPIPIVLSTLPEGRIVDVNQAALTQFNYTREQAVGRTAIDLALWVRPADREHFIHQLQTTGHLEDFEAPMQLRDGRVLNIIHHSRVVSLNGQPHVINTIRDVTRQRQAESELSRLALLAQETDNAVLLTNVHGHIVWTNAGFTRLNGYTLDEVRGRKPGEFLRGPKSDADTNRLIREKLARHERFAIDVLNYHKSGHSYWARLSIQPWRDREGNVQGYFSMATDITDRMLESQTMRLLTLGRAATGGTDVMHYLVRHLPDLLEVDACLIGLPEQPANGRYHSHGFSLDGNLLPEFSAPIAGSLAEDLLKNSETRPPFPVATPAASVLPEHPELVDFVAAPLPGPDNTSLGFIALLCRRPISDEHRHRLVPEIRRLARRLAVELDRDQAEQKFRDLFAFAPDAILIATAEGRITDVNQRALSLFGFSRGEMLGRTADLLMPPEHRAALMQRLQAYLAAPVPHAMGESPPGLVAWDKAGRVFPIDISLSPLTTSQGTFIVAAIRDITKQQAAEEARRQTEAQLRQTQKIESIGTLAGGIAHDFNNILTGMLGAVEIAAMEVPAGHPAAYWLEHISSAGSRAKNLVQQILTFSRKNEGQLIAQPLQPIVAEAVALLRSSIPRMIRIDTRVDASCGPVLADSTQIHQVVMNLCTNAWHAVSEDNGLIEISLTPVRFTPAFAHLHPELPPGDYVRLAIRDNGTGMSAEVRDRIFEPFFTTKGQGHGTGLGLAVVHGIIQGHRGGISVQSEPGEGTQFEIFLPCLGAPTARAQTPAMDALARGHGEPILLVDDDKIALLAVEGMVRHLGYQVTSFSDPQAAWEHFRQQPGEFSLVISDLAMPGMAGPQLAAKLLAADPAIPLLLISGYIDAQKIADLRSLGIRDVLRKPLNLPELAQVIARHLRPPAAG